MFQTFGCYSVTKSCVTLQLHGLQHARLQCPSRSPRVCSNSCPLSRWCYLTISSSATPFSFCLQSLPASKKMKVKVLVAQLCLTLCDSMDCSPPGSSVHGMLEWVAIPFFRGSSWPRDWIQVSCISGRFFALWDTSEAQHQGLFQLNSSDVSMCVWEPSTLRYLCMHSFIYFYTELYVCGYTYIILIILIIINLVIWLSILVLLRIRADTNIIPIGDFWAALKAIFVIVALEPLGL